MNCFSLNLNVRWMRRKVISGGTTIFLPTCLTGETVLKTPKGEYVLKPGDSAFAKKGSIITHNNIHENFCELLVFVPDNFIKTVAQKYQVSLPRNLFLTTPILLFA